MGLDEQLHEILSQLGVVMEQPGSAREDAAGRAPRRNLYQTRDQSRDDSALASDGAEATERERPMFPSFPSARATDGQGQPGESDYALAEANTDMNEATQAAEISLFQTSREHYGVFYRLDLIGGAPQLRIFTPDDETALRMRCYLVRPAIGTPVREWFLATRAHDGSDAYEESRETVEQHLLFAAGEALKRLFWAGEAERMRFPLEIEVARLA
ncbi:MAG TPA: hypothetical protein VMV29_11355 [Ktedonobacterales bacterium]|nr:hypothetical protein [Ktedonobacterales bacterium]